MGGCSFIEHRLTLTLTRDACYTRRAVGRGSGARLPPMDGWEAVLLALTCAAAVPSSSSCRPPAARTSSGRLARAACCRAPTRRARSCVVPGLGPVPALAHAPPARARVRLVPRDAGAGAGAGAGPSESGAHSCNPQRGLRCSGARPSRLAGRKARAPPPRADRSCSRMPHACATLRVNPQVQNNRGARP